MIERDYTEFFEINTDAISTNRGFYYQYLVTLKKWILNYINQKENFIYCEVDDDIKEIGSKLIFTQVKCYSSVFSLKSDRNQIPTSDPDSRQIMIIRGMMNKVMTSVETTTKTISQKSSINGLLAGAVWLT